MTTTDDDGMIEVYNRLAMLRVPFPPEQIGKLPKGGITLDFVGHAHLTGRLLDTDPLWSWEPFALDEQGLPQFDEHGGLWIWLTVCGVRRIGYGDSGGKKGPNGIKEAIGDALRNAGMRFGAALDLWAKTDNSAGGYDRPAPKRKVQRPERAANQDALDSLQSVCAKYSYNPVEVAARFAKENGGEDIRHAKAEDISTFATFLIQEATVELDSDPLADSAPNPADSEDLF